MNLCPSDPFLMINPVKLHVSSSWLHRQTVTSVFSLWDYFIETPGESTSSDATATKACFWNICEDFNEKETKFSEKRIISKGFQLNRVEVMPMDGSRITRKVTASSASGSHMKPVVFQIFFPVWRRLMLSSVGCVHMERLFWFVCFWVW